jgi:hypothetical protein
MVVLCSFDITCGGCVPSVAITGHDQGLPRSSNYVRNIGLWCLRLGLLTIVML